MNKNINLCNNCGKHGHLFHQCKLPITSYGIVAFRKVSNKLQYLMIRRKDSFGYIDFIRGKYSPYNIFQIQNIVNEMSIYEKDKLLNDTFENLWKQMWGNVTHSQYKNEELQSAKKMELIQNSSEINLKSIIVNSTTQWTETEWEFPKGRRNTKENEINCALREFEEETGIKQNKLTIIENVLPFEEIFIGTNHKSYKHKYYLAYMNYIEDENLHNFQVTEISKIEWKTIDECLEAIRPYNLEKKQIIINIDKLLQEYIIV
jgi:8-oxo-dGTP pyrophosphatase MutT (NUDIX family)